MNDDTEHIARRIREASQSVSAPEHLHAHVAEQTARRGPARRRRGLALGGGLATAAAALAVALVLVLGSGAPSMDDAVALALRAPTAGAPAVDPSNPKRIQAQVGGVWFPNYDAYSGWKAVGSRTDEIGGRRAVTVAYRGSGGPVSYTIVDGAPLEVPPGARSREYGGLRATVLRDGVITWEQGGRTCILAGDDADLTALLRAAGRA